MEIGDGREFREYHFCFLFSHRGFLCQSEALHLILGEARDCKKEPRM